MKRSRFVEDTSMNVSFSLPLGEQHPDWSVVIWSLCAQTVVYHHLFDTCNSACQSCFLPVSGFRHNLSPDPQKIKKVFVSSRSSSGLVQPSTRSKGSGAFFVVRRWEINRTDVNEGSLTSSHASSLLAQGSLGGKSPKHTMDHVLPYIASPLHLFFCLSPPPFFLHVLFKTLSVFCFFSHPLFATV